MKGAVNGFQVVFPARRRPGATPTDTVQLESYNWLIEQGLYELFDEITPIESFNKSLELHFPARAIEHCVNSLTSAFVWRAQVRRGRVP